MCLRHKPLPTRIDNPAHLALDAGPSVEASHVDLVIEVTNVSDNGVVLHLGHVGGHDDVLRRQ